MEFRKKGTPPNAKAALKVAQTGTDVPEKDTSPKAKIAKAADGKKGGSFGTAKKLPTEKANSAPVASEPVKSSWEGSMEDWSADYNAAKRKGMTTDQYEDSASDRISDAAGEKRMRDKEASKTPDHPGGYKKGVSAFSNSPKSSHGWGHTSSQKQGHLRTSGHPQGHQIGKKK
jgi:hypothetical protein